VTAAGIPQAAIDAIADDLHERLAAQSGFDPELDDWQAWWRQQVAEALPAAVPHLRAAERANRPRIVCLCGSTRFYDMFRVANLRHTLAGEIVLSIGCDTKSDGDLAAAGELLPGQVKADLDELHKRKIDLADYVLVLNVGGYIGESTRSEIAYAEAHGKPVRYLEPDTAPGRYPGGATRDEDYRDEKWEDATS